jgi:hypothetical protein
MINESLPPKFILVAKFKANSDTPFVMLRKVVLESLSNSTIFSLESVGGIFLRNTKVW